jgi:hypothetical protein
MKTHETLVLGNPGQVALAMAARATRHAVNRKVARSARRASALSKAAMAGTTTTTTTCCFINRHEQ